MPALEKAPVNDRKGGLIGPRLENVDRLLTALTGLIGDQLISRYTRFGSQVAMVDVSVLSSDSGPF
jgi:hypothetical protein